MSYAMTGRRHTSLAKKVSNRELARRAEGAIASHNRTFVTLLAVLAQEGGERVVTQGTIDQVAQHYLDMGYTIVPNPGNAREFIVRLTEGEHEEAPDASITADPPVAEAEHVQEAGETGTAYRDATDDTGGAS